MNIKQLIKDLTWFNLVEKLKKILNKLADASTGGGGDFIPLSGTEVGSPVTGDLEFIKQTDQLVMGLVCNDEGTESQRYIGFGDGGTIALKREDLNSGDLVSINIDSTSIIVASSLPSSKGISSSQDFTANITDLDYVQKKYVDEKVADSRPYKVYTALLTQTGTNAPVATVLENTLGGTIIWTRVNTGEYLATLAGAFTSNKTFINIGQNVTFGIGTGIINSTENTLNSIRVNSSTDFANYDDDILTNTPIEIRVYN